MPDIEGKPDVIHTLRLKLSLRWYLLVANIRLACRGWLGLDADLRDVRTTIHRAVEQEQSQRHANDAVILEQLQRLADQLAIVAKILPAANEAGARLRYYESVYPPLATLRKKHAARVQQNAKQRQRAADAHVEIDGAPRALTLETNDDRSTDGAIERRDDDHRGGDRDPQVVSDGAELDGEGEVRDADVQRTDADGEASEGGGVRLDDAAGATMIHGESGGSVHVNDV